MLTKNDLAKIRKIIREEVEVETESLQTEIQGEIKISRMELQKELRLINHRLKDQEIKIKKLHKDVKTIVNFFDKEYLEMEKRVEKIEQDLKLSAFS